MLHCCIVTYPGSQLPPGNYSVFGRDASVNMTTPAQKLVRTMYVPVLQFLKECNDMNYSANATCTTLAAITSQGNQLNGTLYLNGNEIGATNTTISNTVSGPGTYRYVFSTAGNSRYSSKGVNYTFTIAAQPRQAGTFTPAILALLIAIAAAVALYGAARRRRQPPQSQALEQI